MSDDITRILSSLHPLERKVLAAFQDRSPIDDEKLLEACGLDEARLSMAVGWLAAKGLLTSTGTGLEETVTVTELGRQYLKEGLPGLRIVEQITGESPVTVAHLRSLMEPGEVSKAIGALKEKDLIRIATGGVVEVNDAGLVTSEVVSRWQRLGGMIASIDAGGSIDSEKMEPDAFALAKEYAGGRGKKGIFDVHEKQRQRYGLTDSGQRLLEQLTSETAVGEEVAQLTPDLLKDGSWREKRFRKYNIALPAPRIAMAMQRAAPSPFGDGAEIW